MAGSRPSDQGTDAKCKMQDATSDVHGPCWQFGNADKIQTGTLEPHLRTYRSNIQNLAAPSLGMDASQVARDNVVLLGTKEHVMHGVKPFESGIVRHLI
jgi:hypothetical protein